MKNIIFIVFLFVLILNGCGQKSIPISPAVEDLTRASDSVIIEVIDNVEVKSEEIEEKKDIKIENIKVTPSDYTIRLGGSVEIFEEYLNLPATYDVHVDFVPQAPLDNWGLPYQEACEEACLITVAKHFAGEPLTKEIMDSEIKKLVEWEKENLGTYTDTNVEEVARIAREYFGLKVEIIEEVNVLSLKREIAKGNLVIAPFAGRELGNPYFTPPGPLYHMMILRGYTKDEFITNDVGTRRGGGYKYDADVIVRSLRDLPLKPDGSVYRLYDDKSLSDNEKKFLIKNSKQRFLSISPK